MGGVYHGQPRSIEISKLIQDLVTADLDLSGWGWLPQVAFLLISNSVISYFCRGIPGLLQLVSRLLLFSGF
jgi:hypothetical protein